jgi:hypothetical protein
MNQRGGPDETPLAGRDRLRLMKIAGAVGSVSGSIAPYSRLQRKRRHGMDENKFIRHVQRRDGTNRRQRIRRPIHPGHNSKRTLLKEPAVRTGGDLSPVIHTQTDVHHERSQLTLRPQHE